MTEELKNEPSPDEIWYLYLTQGERAMQEKMPRLMRSMTQTTSHVFNLLPSDPRCVWCNAPFQGAGGWLMKAMGRRQSDYNPSICTAVRISPEIIWAGRKLSFRCSSPTCAARRPWRKA